MKIEQMRPDERKDLFESVAFDPGGALPRPVAAEIIEKDWWVCFILDRLLGVLTRNQGAAPPVVFKGGTSLSKAYGLIRRFSEDVDLTLDPALLGVNLDGLEAASKSQRRKRLEELEEKCVAFVHGELRQLLDRDLQAVLGGGDWVAPDGDVEEPGTLRFTYPSAVSRGEYLLPFVRLEFGSRSEREPWECRSVRSYAAIARPGLDLEQALEVPTLMAGRTFWEKATILHAEGARARTHMGPPPRAWRRLSRHASDLVGMAGTDVVTAAIGDESLLRRVCTCKAARFPVDYVDYGAVQRASVSLTPPEPLASELARDYGEMRAMFFEEPAPWSTILRGLEQLEARIHEAGSSGA